MSEGPKDVCPACGCGDLCEGMPVARGLFMAALTFHEMPKHFRPPPNALLARKCNGCGNVQFYVAGSKR